MAGDLILCVGYGINIKPKDDPYLETVGAAIKPLLIAAIPGAFLVDSFPVMKYIPAWFPGASFKRLARKWRILTERMVNVPFDVAKADYVGPVSGFMRYMLTFRPYFRTLEGRTCHL